MNIREKIAEYNPDAIVFDGLDDAIIGVGKQHGGETVVVYDRQKCIDIFYYQFLREGNKKSSYADEEMSKAGAEAIEWFEFNVECAYMGANTPVFVESIDLLTY